MSKTAFVGSELNCSRLGHVWFLHGADEKGHENYRNGMRNGVKVLSCNLPSAIFSMNGLQVSDCFELDQGSYPHEITSQLKLCSVVLRWKKRLTESAKIPICKLIQPHFVASYVTSNEYYVGFDYHVDWL